MTLVDFWYLPQRSGNATAPAETAKVRSE